MKASTFLAVLITPLALVAQGQPAVASPYQAAADYSAKSGGVAVLVMRDGKTVFEDYRSGYTASKPHHLWSGTKSFAATIAVLASADGLLSLDEPVSKTIQEWREDDSKKGLTIRHLLSFTSGLRLQNERGAEMQPNRYGNALKAELRGRPGRRFRYASLHLMVFGEIMRRKLAAAQQGDNPPPKDLVSYLKKRVLDPIGCKIGNWRRDRSKNPMLAWGASFGAAEWAKFGQLILQKGRWGNKQLLPAKMLAECFVGSKANRLYGLNWWLWGKALNRRDQRIPADTASAAGMFGQKLYVIPSRNMVIVRLAKDRSQGFSDMQFLKRVFANANKPAKRRRVL